MGCRKKFFKVVFIIISVLIAIALAMVTAHFTIKNARMAFSNEVLSSYVSNNLTADNQIASTTDEKPSSLVVTAPSSAYITVNQPDYTITGTSNPEKALIINGQRVDRLEGGEFSLNLNLNPGKNTVSIEHEGQVKVFTINYAFTVIKAFSPCEKQTYEAGSTFAAVALARVDSTTVTATFNGQTITLQKQPHQDGDEFVNFTGVFTLPTGNEDDLNLGKVKFTAECNGVKQSYSSLSIICPRDKALDGTQVVEIISNQAETFNGNTTDDWSRPTNSYLPKGTLDYKIGKAVTDPVSGERYYNLRCGKRVYITKENHPETTRVTVSKMYTGELPEFNEVSLNAFEVGQKHTVFTFDTAWKAPFLVELLPQNYNNPSVQDYSVSSVSYTYMDIKFCYTNTLGGDFTLPDNPLFSSAQILSANDGYILRLHFKKVGAFYGWHADYNAAGQLVFKFLNPSEPLGLNNLTGIKILLEAGHGGKDPGALGLRPKTMFEAERNLSLAFKLKSELESYGATVVMSRTSDIYLTSDQRSDILRRELPDLCIAIHHDSNPSSSANGATVYTFNAISENASKYIFNSMHSPLLYNKIEKGWHWYFLGRVTACPVVLTENGYMSSPVDFAGISDENTNIQKAKSIARGVLDYFNSFVQ